MLKFLSRGSSRYNTRALIQWMWRTSRSMRTQAAINAGTACLSVGLDFAFIWATKMAIDTATHQSATPLQLAAGLLIAILASQVTLGLFARWIRALLGVKAQNRMRRRLFTHLLESEWQGLNARHSGDVLNRLERDVSDVVSALTETLPSLLAVIIRLLGAFVLLYSMDAKLAVLAVVILPISILLSRLYIRKMRALTREVRHTDSRIQSTLQESIQHRMVIKTLERENTQTHQLETIQDELFRQVKRRTLFSTFSSGTLNAGFAMCYLVTFIWGVARLHEGTITYGMMMAFIQLVGQIQGPFRDMTRFVPVLINALTAGERLMELEEVPAEEAPEPHRFAHPTGIRLDHITYSYGEGKRQVIRDLSFDFTPGSSTAILGETGAGKTTLIRLILALMKPAEGRITFYDTHGEEAPCSPATRCNLVYVPQGNTLFSGTVRDNLLLGNPQATEEEMKEVLHDACADFVFSLPDGLDTRIGEMGTGLSEGQAQRIAVARALLRQGRILLLDEATSALDPATERTLLENLTRKHLAGRTLLFITHRPAVVDACTQVIRLEREEYRLAE